MKKAYYDLSVNNPGAVAWYCALKLEMAVHLTKALLTKQLRSADVPGLEVAKAKWEKDLERQLDWFLADSSAVGPTSQSFADFATGGRVNWQERNVLSFVIALGKMRMLMFVFSFLCR